MTGLFDICLNYLFSESKLNRSVRLISHFQPDSVTAARSGQSMTKREKWKNRYIRYGYLIWYGAFGAITVLVNIGVYALMFNGLHAANVPSNILAWFLSNLVAFLTNKQYVFKSRDWSWRVVKHEARGFFVFRGISGIFDVIMMWLLVDVYHWFALPSKIIINILVILLNFIATRFWVFKDTGNDSRKDK